MWFDNKLNLPLNPNQLSKYFDRNFSPNQKILISISCGLDSTVMYNLIIKSQFFKPKNIFCIFFDHQKRAEGKYEIENFIKYYGVNIKNVFVKKLKLEKNKLSFQNKARVARHKYNVKLTKMLGTDELFLGHHLDDLKESYFLRRIQSSNALGLSNIFNEKIEGLNIHRPLVNFTKKQIKVYAKKNNLIWFEDRSNIELDYTRNKIRSYLASNSKISKFIEKEKKNYQDIEHMNKFYSYYFEKLSKKRFEIKFKKLKCLNKTLQITAVQSLYYYLRLNFKKQPRNENFINFIDSASLVNQNISSKRAVFGGKIGFFKKKLCLNLT